MVVPYSILCFMCVSLHSVVSIYIHVIICLYHSLSYYSGLTLLLCSCTVVEVVSYMFMFSLNCFSLVIFLMLNCITFTITNDFGIAAQSLSQMCMYHSSYEKSTMIPIVTSSVFVCKNPGYFVLHTPVRTAVNATHWKYNSLR